MKVKAESEKAGLNLNIRETKIMASGPITWWQIKGEKVEKWQIFFSWATKSLQMVTTARKLKFLGRKASSHVWMCELDHKEVSVLKN